MTTILETPRAHIHKMLLGYKKGKRFALYHLMERPDAQTFKADVVHICLTTTDWELWKSAKNTLFYLDPALWVMIDKNHPFISRLPRKERHV